MVHPGLPEEQICNLRYLLNFPQTITIPAVTLTRIYDLLAISSVSIGNPYFGVIRGTSTFYDGYSLADWRRSNEVSFQTPFGTPVPTNGEELHLFGQMLNPVEIKLALIDLTNNISSWFKTTLYSGAKKQEPIQQIYGH